MARQIADNLIYKAPKPLDERLYFATYDEMQAYPKDMLYDGAICYCDDGDHQGWYTYTKWLPTRSDMIWNQLEIRYQADGLEKSFKKISDPVAAGYNYNLLTSAYNNSVIKENPNCIIKLEDKKYVFERLEAGIDPDGNTCNWRVCSCINGAGSLMISTTAHTLGVPPKPYYYCKLSEGYKYVKQYEHFFAIKRTSYDVNYITFRYVDTTASPTNANMIKWLYDNGFTSQNALYPAAGLAASNTIYVASSSGGSPTTQFSATSCINGIFSPDGTNLKYTYRSGTDVSVDAARIKKITSIDRGYMITD